MAMILEGIRVVDCTVLVAGPDAAASLADLGADVLHVEQPKVGDPLRGVLTLGGVSMQLKPSGRHALFETTNRNKRSITIDLRKPAGRGIIYQLIEKSDVFMTNMRPGTIKQWGLHYEALREHNPKLIYAAMNAFGPEGPDANLPGVDLSMGARSGIMAMMGSATEPVSVPLCDKIASVALFQGVLAALLARERFGVGQKVTTSGIRSTMSFLELGIQRQVYGLPPTPKVDRTKAPNPVYNYYKCKDDNWLCLALFFDKLWAPFCNAINMPELVDDPRFTDAAARAENCEELVRLLDNVFATKPYKEWETALLQMETPIVSHVNTVADLFSDPQVLANKDIVDWDHPALGPIKWVAPPVAFSETPATLRLAAPECGQHTEEVLSEILGYTHDEIGRLQEQELI